MATYRQQTGILGAITTCPSCVAPSSNPAGFSRSTLSEACSSTDITYYFYFEDNTIANGGTVYTDQSLSTVFVGDNGWYRVSVSGESVRSMQINASGEISTLSLCP